MLVVGYVGAIRSERLICREVQVNLAYRWFCKPGIEDAVPDHSAFSRARNERFHGGVFFAACLSVSSRRALRPIGNSAYKSVPRLTNPVNDGDQSARG
jgi:hypothetical protein